MAQPLNSTAVLGDAGVFPPSAFFQILASNLYLATLAPLLALQSYL